MCRQCPIRMAAIIIVSLGIGCFVPLTTFAESSLIDSVVDLFQKNTLGNLEGMYVWEMLIPILVIIFLFYFLSNVLPPFVNSWCEQMELIGKNEVEQKLMKKLDRIPYENLEKTEFKDKWNRVAKKTDEKLPELFSMLTELLRITISVVGMLWYIAVQSFMVSVIYLIVLLLLFWFSKKAAAALFTLNQNFSISERRILYMNEITNHKEYAAERKLFQYTPFINQKREEIMKQQRVEQKKHDFKYAFFSSGIDVAGYIATIVIVLFMFPQLKIHAISMGFFLAFTRASLSLNSTIQNGVKKQLDILAQQRVYWKEYWELLEIKEISVSTKKRKKENFCRLEFCHVDFSYPNGTNVLKDVSFIMEPGKHYALVGENGSGKSTIVKLILGLYRPTGGKILLNGMDIQEFTSEELMEYYSVVFQDFSRYAIPFRENIILNQAEKEEKYQEILEYVELSSCVNRLKEGSHTMLGTIEKNGVDLSGGEWQKIAIGRALYRNAGFTIFDEPTASLDPMAESRIYEKYYQMMKGKTTIFISHRLASATLADVILVLKNKKICEMGGHKDLINKQGEYYKMFMTQRKWYWGDSRNE